MTKNVTTYSTEPHGAEVNLCSHHAEHPPECIRVPMQIQRGRHEGTCDACPVPDPIAPPCTHDNGHHWKQTYFQRNGGEVICRDRCIHCPVTREIDSWAQDPDTGEQGLDSVTYGRDEQ